ncbi:MAG: hypothetical protein KDK91_11755 [Gammaproteobacteria bacterium]|nr:hypothetical protein [Gammaproteobacteria bacterium]
MPMTLLKVGARFKGASEVDDAERLLAWLQERPDARINLRDCTHLHSAVLQVLLAARPKVSIPPDDERLASWLMPLMRSDDGPDEAQVHD